MIRRILAFIGGAILGYILAVIGAFVFWDLIGSSGADYGPLLFVLFGVAPAVAVVTGLLAARSMRSPATPPMAEAPKAPLASLPAHRNSPAQVAVAVVVALLVGVILWATGTVPHAPLFLPR